MTFWKSNFPNKNQNQEVQVFYKFYFHFLFSCLKAENVSFGYKFGSILVRWIEPYSSIEPLAFSVPNYGKSREENSIFYPSLYFFSLIISIIREEISIFYP